MNNKNKKNKPNKRTYLEQISNEIIFEMNTFDKVLKMYQMSVSLENTKKNILVACESEINNIFDIYIINANGKHLLFKDEEINELHLIGRFDTIILHGLSEDFYQEFKKQYI